MVSQRTWIIGAAVAVVVIVVAGVALLADGEQQATKKQQQPQPLTLEQVKAWPVCGPKAPPPNCRGDGRGRPILPRPAPPPKGKSP